MIMSRSATAEDLQNLTDILVEVSNEEEGVLLLISSDLSHYHPAQTAEEIDRRGLDAVLKGDIEGLWEGHNKKEMEIDGFKEVITSLMYAKQMGCDQIELLKYGNSGDTSGDYSRVVGYAAIVMS